MIDLDFYFSVVWNEGDQITERYQKFSEEVALIQTTIPVETAAQAAIPKKLLNIGG